MQPWVKLSLFMCKLTIIARIRWDNAVCPMLSSVLDIYLAIFLLNDIYYIMPGLLKIHKILASSLFKIQCPMHLPRVIWNHSPFDNLVRTTFQFPWLQNSLQLVHTFAYMLILFPKIFCSELPTWKTRFPDSLLESLSLNLYTVLSPSPKGSTCWLRLHKLPRHCQWENHATSRITINNDYFMPVNFWGVIYYPETDNQFKALEVSSNLFNSSSSWPLWCKWVLRNP